ncbi:hypothetical protein [Sporosarcina sp. NPDC096371]|uniref:hypothetical protein n=1 Tax=Sporosarcina sp. NPDC096371 TaxID=3364530 RepID=UPI0037F207EC
MNGLILGVDAGNNGTKVTEPYGLDISKTAICGWFERYAEEAFGGGSMFGDTKAHDNNKITVLLASERPDTSYSPDTYENT